MKIMNQKNQHVINHSNPLLNNFDEQCNACSVPFKRSSLSFEILPLVEFKPSSAITDVQAIDFIKMSSKERIKKNIVQKNNENGVQTLKSDTENKNANFYLKVN